MTYCFSIYVAKLCLLCLNFEVLVIAVATLYGRASGNKEYAWRIRLKQLARWSAFSTHNLSLCLLAMAKLGTFQVI